MFFERVVELVDLFQQSSRSRPLRRTWIRRWSSSLIIRLDFLASVEADAAGAVGFGMFAADELPLDQKLTVEILQMRDVDVAEAPSIRNWSSRERNMSSIVTFGIVVCPVGESELRQVASQTDSAGDNDIGVGTGAARPLASCLCVGLSMFKSAPPRLRAWAFPKPGSVSAHRFAGGQKTLNNSSLSGAVSDEAARTNRP